MAKCPGCHQQVVLARVCPYCGAPVPQLSDDDTPKRASGQSGRRRAGKAARGGFVGPMAGPQDAPRTPWQWVSTFLQYMWDGAVPVTKKLVVGFLAFYVIWPFDILPDYLPIAGWLDDIGAVALLWSFLRSELGNYRRLRRTRQP